MATNIGGVSVDMLLESAAFRRDMQRSQQLLRSETAKMRRSLRQVEMASRNVSRSFSQFRAGIAALAGALAVRQFSQFTKNALSAGAAIQDIADKVSVSTTELQQMRFAAIQTGVGVRALDMGLQRFSRRIGEVAQGQGELLKTAQQYNVTLRNADGTMRSNIDILKDFADVIKNAESQQERLRIAFKLFDSEGAALVNTLRDGRVGLEAFMKQAEAFGAVMTKEVVAKAKLADDNLTSLTEVFKTAFNTSIIEGFASSLTLSEDRLRAVQMVGEQFGKTVAAAMRGVAEAAKFVADNLEAIKTALIAIAALKAAAMFRGIGVAILGLVGALTKARAGLLALQVLLISNPLTAAVGVAGLLAGALFLVAENSDRARAATGDYAEAVEATNAALNTSVDVSESVRQARLMEAVAANEAAIATENLTRARKQEALDRLVRQRRAAAARDTGATVAEQAIRGITGTPTDEGFATNIDRARANLADSDARIKSLRDNLDSLTQTLKSTAAATHDVASATGQSSIKFSDATKTLENEVLQLQLRTIALRKGTAAVLKQAENEAVLAQVKKAGIDVTKKLNAVQLKEVSHIKDLVRIRLREIRVNRQLERSRNLEEELKFLKEEARLIGKTDKERAVALARMRTEAQLRREGIDLKSKDAQAEIALAETIARTKDELQKATRARELFVEPFKNAISGIQDAFSSAFENIFSGGVDSFSDLAATVKRIFVRLAAEIAALLIFRPAVAGALGSVGLGGLGASLTGGSAGGGLLGGFPTPPLSLFGNIGSTLNQLGAAIGIGPQLVSGPGSFFGLSTAGSLTSASLTSLLGAAGIGAFGGGLLAQLTGGNQIGGSIGGGLGAALGAAFPILGPLTPIAGGLAGSLLGGLFGGSESVGPNAAARINFQNGRLVLGPTGADNGGNLAATVRVAQQTIARLNQLAEELGLVFSNVLRGANVITDRPELTTFGGFTSGEEFFNALLARGGVSTAGGQTLNASSLAELVQTQAAEMAAAVLAGQDASQIRAFLSSQLLSRTSSLSPAGRLAESQRQFGDLLARARGGEAGLGGELTRSAQTLLGFARQNFASTVSFANIETFVRSSLESVAATLEEQAETVTAGEQAIVEEIRELEKSEEVGHDLAEGILRELRLLRAAI